LSGATIGFDDVGVRYADADGDALRGVSFDVASGEVVAIVGPSGCGKTTLLRTVNRLVEPTSGAVLIDGVDVRTMDAVALRRRVGYAIQAVGLFAHMTVAENVGIVPSLLGWPRDRIDRRVDDLLERVHLDPKRFRDRRPRKLSGGEAQRVGVARALGGEPGVLLMDEPFGAVDAVVRTALQDETLRIHRALGTTIFFVTHDVDEALRMADRIVIMSAGTIVQADTPLRLLANPATPYVDRLLDAHDAVRRLQLMLVREAMAPPGEAATPTQGAIDGALTLRQALSAFLEGADRLAVTDADRPIGTLGFDDVRRAIASTEASTRA